MDNCNKASCQKFTFKTNGNIGANVSKQENGKIKSPLTDRLIVVQSDLLPISLSSSPPLSLSLYTLSMPIILAA